MVESRYMTPGGFSYQGRADFEYNHLSQIEGLH